MPNTLAHIGAQLPLTRAFLRRLDPKALDPRIVLLGCMLPDLPWILNRVLRMLIPGIDLIDLRLHAIVMSSLFFSLLLAAAISFLTRQTRTVFAVLALGSTLHLILDALQIKWANGVHLLAPVSWTLVRFDLFWPTSPANYALTGLGVLVAGWTLWRRNWSGWPLRPRGRASVLAAAAFIAAYATIPWAIREFPYAADNHFVRTLRELEARPGRSLELDRNWYAAGAEGHRIITWTNESLEVESPVLDHDAVVSVRGMFMRSGVLRVDEIHDHSGSPRDPAVILGLLVVVAAWTLPGRKRSTTSS